MVGQRDEPASVERILLENVAVKLQETARVVGVFSQCVR